jgi:hypothetical protein
VKRYFTVSAFNAFVEGALLLLRLLRREASGPPSL